MRKPLADITKLDQFPPQKKNPIEIFLPMELRYALTIVWDSYKIPLP
jgi:hypothetical protein